MNIIFVFGLILVYAFDQPKVVSMGDLKLEKREESLIYQVFNFIIHHRWIFAACLFSVIIGVLICLIIKRQKEIGDIKIPEEEIYLEGRKLCLPKSQMLNLTKDSKDCSKRYLEGGKLCLPTKKVPNPTKYSKDHSKRHLVGRVLCLPTSQMLNFAKDSDDSSKKYPIQEAKKFPCF